MILLLPLLAAAALFAAVVACIRGDCASGRVGALQIVGNPRKKRGAFFQKFQTACAGRPSPRIGQASKVAVEVERMPDGRNMTEYTFGVGGDLRCARHIRQAYRRAVAGAYRFSACGIPST